MPAACVITFNENPSGVFHSGQILSGVVNLTTDKIKAVKSIHVTICGSSFVCWLESSGFINYRSMKLFFAHEEYLKSRTDLMTNTRNNGKPFDLNAGNYEYYFQVALPRELPSSFNSKHGKIVYEAICTIERSKQFDIEFKHPFTVINPLDLNLHQLYMEPVSREVNQSINKLFFCWGGGMMKIKASTPYGGYVPGQIISVSFYINNQTPIGVYDTMVSLRQVVEYRSYTPHKQSKYEARIIESKSFGKLDKGQEKNFYCNFNIPAIAPSSLSSSRIIEISYDVEIYLKTYEFYQDINVRLPITIGTMPRRNPPIGRGEYGNQTDAESNDQQAPPTYEEAVRLGPNFIDSRKANALPENDYVPRYPVYNMNHSVAARDDIPAVIVTQPMETS